MQDKRSALIVGATGLVGTELVKLLCDSDQYDLVKVVVRRPLTYTHPKLVILVREFDHITKEDVGEVKDVFCCLGTTIKKAGSREAFKKVDFTYPESIAKLAKKQKVEHFLIISAMGADENSAFFYSRVKGMIEKELIKMDFPQLSIFRPSLLTGERNEFRLGETFGAMVLKVINPILFGPLKKYRSIPGKQVASAMKFIALNRNNKKVTVYTSDKIAALK